MSIIFQNVPECYRIQRLLECFRNVPDYCRTFLNGSSYSGNFHRFLERFTIFQNFRNFENENFLESSKISKMALEYSSDCRMHIPPHSNIHLPYLHPHT